MYEIQTLFIRNVFGMYDYSDSLYDKQLEEITYDYHHLYYQYLIAPNAHSVLSDLKRVDKLGKATNLVNSYEWHFIAVRSL